MFRRILSWKTLSVLFWGTLKDKEFAGKGIVFRRGVCDGGSLISEAGSWRTKHSCCFVGGVREGGQVKSLCGLTPAQAWGPQVKGFLTWPLILHQTKLPSSRGRAIPTHSQGVEGDPEIC